MAFKKWFVFIRPVINVVIILSLLVIPTGQKTVAEPGSPDSPVAFVEASSLIDPATLDPALDYEMTGGHILQQVYETLVFYDREKIDAYIPMLATGWEISPDGLTYTFRIREGVQFHDGASLTPTDVSYSLQRGILQGGSASPQLLLTEALLGVGIYDITQLVDPGGSLLDDRSALQAQDPSLLDAACKAVTSAIEGDDLAGTVTFHLAQAWSPFLGTLAHPVGSILDMDWAIANGTWEGDCADWQNHYFVDTGSDPLSSIENGSGPFFLEYWSPSSEISLRRFDAYWRSESEPMWEGGPGGIAALERILIRQVPDETERYNQLTGGAVDTASSLTNYYTDLEARVLYRYETPDGGTPILENPDGDLKQYRATANLAYDAMLNYSIQEGGTNDYLGSKALDGSGIPADFFNDVHIRRAFSYAINYDKLLSDLYGEDVLRRRGPIPSGVIGYSPSSSIYEYNPALAETEMGLATTWGPEGSVPGTGFILTISYPAGQTRRQMIAEAIKADIEALNPKYHVNLLELSTWKEYTDDWYQGYSTIFTAGWQADIASPYNWVTPYMVGSYAVNLNPTMRSGYQTMIDACLEVTGSAEVACYEGLQQAAYTDAMGLFLVQAIARNYLRSDVNGYYFNSLVYGAYFYALSKDPALEPNTADTLIEASPFIDPDTLDPALDYETTGGRLLQQVYDTLVFFDREQVEEYVPMLATGWTISPDGLTYTFDIRQGVQFHNGNDLTPSDVAYTFQRGILQGGGSSPQLLYTEPLLGIGIQDITQLVDPSGGLIDDRGALQAWDPASDLLAACNQVQSAVVADDLAGTVTFHLAQPWTPFLGTLAHTSGSIMDMQWTMENGGWDGDCANWQNYYFAESGSDPFTRMENGTGPFSLEYWYPDTEIRLRRFDGYWRNESDPMWPGGPSGVAAFEQVIIWKIADEGMRYDLLTSGAVDYATSLSNYYGALDADLLYRYESPDGLTPTLVNSDGNLKLYRAVDAVSLDAFFNYDIHSGGSNDYLGSGALDGAGIPGDFFNDLHVREAFNHAINYDQLFADLYGGEALRRRGPIPSGVMGYLEASPIFDYNPAEANTEFSLAASWGTGAGEVTAHGFTLTLSYNMYSVSRTAVAERIKADIEALNPLFHVNLLPLTYQAYVADWRAGYSPIYVAGWMADIASPYNWVQPYMVGAYAINLPDSTRTTYDGMIRDCLATSGSAEVSCYEGLQATAIDDAMAIFLAQPVTRAYLRAEVMGHYRNPLMSGPYIYALSEGPLPVFNTGSTFVDIDPFVDPDTLDPALDYETAGVNILRQVYDTLILFDREQVESFIPMLATGWTISPDGLTYTFDIRQGVTFQNDASLTPSDVAYTFQRGILQGGSNSPQWLLSEPLFGSGITDVTYLVDPDGSLVNDRAGLQAQDPGLLSAACGQVTSAIEADDVAGTVTFHLTQAWPPFMSTLAGSWGSILDQGWAVAGGAWDGDCGTWQDYYYMESGTDPFTAITNGTGPYILQNWIRGDEIRLVRNEHYWRSVDDPMWEGAPGGLAFYDLVILKAVPTAYDRYNWLVSGLADTAAIPAAYYAALEDKVLLKYDQSDVLTGTLVNPDGSLKRYDDTIYPASYDAFFNYQINSGGARSYLGSGTWDGAGIPADFFNDIHVRKAFSYAFNYDQYLIDQEQFMPGAIRRRGPIPAGLIGYSDTSTIYGYDPITAANEMIQAWGGEAATHGFTLTLAYPAGDGRRQLLANRIKTDIEALSPGYHILVEERTQEEYTEDRGNGSLPIFANGWQADIPHPYNWVMPYMVNFYAQIQGMPESARDAYSSQINACMALDGAAEATCFEGVQSTAMTDAIDLFLTQPQPRTYLNAEVRGYYENAYMMGLYYYALSEGTLPATEVIDPGSGLEVIFDEGLGSSTTVDIPAGAVVDPLDLVITADSRTIGEPAGFKLGNLAFIIQPYQAGEPIEGLAFDPGNPVWITLAYDPLDVLDLFEDSLTLFYWNGSSWEDASCGTILRDPVANTISVPVCHFSQFALGGSGISRVFLPILRRN